MERTAEMERQIIAALRREDETPAKKTKSGIQAIQETGPNPIGRQKQSPSNKTSKPARNKTDRRLTVRLDQELYEKVQKYCHDAALDYSILVRKALSDFFNSDAASKDKSTPTMPGEALRLIGRYQTWGYDLRDQFRARFLDILAMAHVTTKRWARTPWVREIYLGLLQLYQHLESENVRQS